MPTVAGLTTTTLSRQQRYAPTIAVGRGVDSMVGSPNGQTLTVARCQLTGSNAVKRISYSFT
jgi:hypothetical protein